MSPVRKLIAIVAILLSLFTLNLTAAASEKSEKAFYWCPGWFCRR